MNELSLTYSTINNIDVLVIGAGPVGLATTIWFAKRDYTVALIEQYSGVENSERSFNRRHQQVGLNPDSLNFIKHLDVIAWGEIKRKGCVDGDWINIPIYILQNILVKEIRNHKNATIIFDSVIQSVTCTDQKHNCRVTFISNDAIYGVSPKIIVIADGKHDDNGVAKRFFNFSSACKVSLSTYGIVGTIERNSSNERGSICLKNYSSNSYMSENNQDLGNMYIRLLGNMRERYIALGLGDSENMEKFKNLSNSQIKKLLVEAYNQKRDRNMGEPEIDENSFSDCSRSPIPIVLDYRKETIKLLEGSKTICSIEGDCARKTTFFSGSGLNSGYKALQILFNFCQENKSLIFSNSKEYLAIDQKLLEKDKECMQISLELLIKGTSYITHKNTETDTRVSLSRSFDNHPVIESVYPNFGQPSWFVYINGENLVSDGKPPTCIFEWESDTIITNDIIIYNSNTIGVKIPSNAKGIVNIKYDRGDGKTTTSPVSYNAVEVTDSPEIIKVHKNDGYWCIDGKNFKTPTYVEFYDPQDTQNRQRVKAYCHSINSLVFVPIGSLGAQIAFIAHTSNGSSNEFIISRDLN